MRVWGGEREGIGVGREIGCEVVNVLYIVDEGSMGVDEGENMGLINCLKEVGDLGNRVMVVEDEKEMMVGGD